MVTGSAGSGGHERRVGVDGGTVFRGALWYIDG